MKPPPFPEFNRWLDALLALPPPQGRAIAGISGGRTSAIMMHLLARAYKNVLFSFQNTGLEHKKTLDFLCYLEDDIQRPIIRVEYRAPPRGDEPKYSTFEVVTHQTMSRRGEPFLDLLFCLAAYRKKHKGLGPTGPWAKSRLCTAHLKLKTKVRLCRSLGWDDYTDYVGLRADEWSRVQKMNWRNQDKDTDERAPLFTIGVRKDQVHPFWALMPYDLGVPDYLGNCKACFMKDEGDLATALRDPETEAGFWIQVDETFKPMRRGRANYRQVYEEAPARFRIRTALECSVEPEPEKGLAERRFLALVRQERVRLENGPEEFSCSCEAAERMDDNADE